MPVGTLEALQAARMTDDRLTETADRELMERARELVKNSRAPSTRNNYERYWRKFVQWCALHGVSALPARSEDVAVYLADQSREYRYATLRICLSAISVAHHAASFPSPTRSLPVNAMMRGIARTYGAASEGRAPFLATDVQAAVSVIARNRNRSIVLRDTAIITIGFAAALRRSEIVALTSTDIKFVDGGMVVSISRSKTDQFGFGEHVAVSPGSSAATCPVVNARRIIAAVGGTGPLFQRVYRSGRFSGSALGADAVTVIVKAYASQLYDDATLFGAHSLRAGLITSAYQAGVSDVEIMRQSRHKQIENCRRYVRPADNFVTGLTARMGL